MKFVRAFLVALSVALVFSLSAAEPKISVFLEDVDAYSKQAKISVAEAASRFVEAGVTGIDYGYDEKFDVQAAVGAGMQVVNVYGVVDFLSADRGAKTTDAFLNRAVELKSPRVMLIPGYFSKNGNKEKEIAAIIAGIRGFIAKAKAKGLDVLIEDFGNPTSPCSQLKYLRMMMKDCRELGFALDSGNLAYSGYGDDILDALQDFDGRIRHVHLKDHPVGDDRKYVSLGTGTVPNAEILRTLALAKYDGWITLENFVGDDYLVDVRRQVTFVRKTLESAMPLRFAFVANHADSTYRCGETADITITAFVSNGVRATVGKVTVQLDPSQPTNAIFSQVIDLAKTNPFTVSGSLAKPGFLWARVSGAAAKGVNRPYQSFAFDPQSIRRACTRPADFDAWWDAQVAKLDCEVPIDVQMMPYPERASEGCELYKVSFASFGRRVWGYLSVPKDKSKAPFPVRVRVPGAGVGAWSNRLGKAQADEIVLFMAVYPWEPSWDDWKNVCLPQLRTLDAQSVRKYGLVNGGGCYQSGISESREAYYYYSSILGINRAVNWVAQRKDVDRKNFTYSGHSQGGGFGLFLLGLNRNFTRGVINEPAITDLLGCDVGRVSGWPRLLECQSREKVAIARKWAPYFDGACFAERIRVPVRMIVGFADVTCPPTAVYSAYNAIPVKGKRMVDGLESTHHVGPELTASVNAWECERVK